MRRFYALYGPPLGGPLLRFALGLAGGLEAVAKLDWCVVASLAWRDDFDRTSWAG